MKSDTSVINNSFNGLTLLHKIVAKGDITFIKDIIEMGGNPRIKDNFGRTPLFYAKHHRPIKRKEIMDLLISLVGPCVLVDRDNNNMNCIAYWNV